MPAIKLAFVALGSARALTRSDRGPFLENAVQPTLIPSM